MGEELVRDHLPPDPPYAGRVYEDAKDPEATFPPIEPRRPPAGAPNVLIVLLDDVGFGASSAFGGPCATPTAERLAANGLKLNRFHTTALCSPSGGLAKGGTVTLCVDGDEVGEGRVEATIPLIFSGDETCDVGSDTASPVAADYTPETSHFTGKIEWVQIDIDEAAENVDHLISPEERLRAAMARQ